jgi:hypothetical protein
MAARPDYLVATIARRVVWVEVKTPTGRQSPKQVAFQKMIEEMGFEYYIVRSLEEFQRLVLTWLPYGSRPEWATWLPQETAGIPGQNNEENG